MKNLRIYNIWTVDDINLKDTIISVPDIYNWVSVFKEVLEKVDPDIDSFSYEEIE